MLLVGPSAGYTFPDAFFRRFEQITVFDPDPLAALLLSRRLRGLGIRELTWQRSDELFGPLLEDRPGLAERLAREPKLCLAFGNLLGQSRFLLSDREFLRFKARFRERVRPLLLGRSWLSFHDRLSGTLAPSFGAPHREPARLDDAALLCKLYPTVRGASSVELFDHQSGGFFPSALPHAYFDWQIDRVRHHLIEGVGSFDQRG